MTYEAYLRLEASSPERRHEFLRGEVWAMAGGTPEHALFASNVLRHVGARLGGKPCNIFGSDLRLRIDSADRTTYPDAVVVCGARETSPVDALAVTNPVVIVEVTSDGTEADDRGEKFAHYRHLASLEEYVIVSHRQHRSEVYRRGGNSWTLREYLPGDEVELASLEVRFPVEAIYEDSTRP